MLLYLIGSLFGALDDRFDNYDLGETDIKLMRPVRLKMWGTLAGFLIVANPSCIIGQ